MKGPIRSICDPLVAGIIVLLSHTAEAGRMPEPWDNLPQIDTLVFRETEIGLVSMDLHYFFFNTRSRDFREIREAEFHRRFPGPMPPHAREVVKNTGTGSEVRLRTSDSLEFTTWNAYCSEGENITHRLSLNGKPLKDFVEHCYSISAAEKVRDQVWLGTRSDGEYGDYPAEGIVVQSLDGRKKIGQIQTGDGLTGDLVRVIRRSPSDSLVWVATNQGFNAIGVDLKIKDSAYFYQDFDPGTGKPTFLISPTPRETPQIVVLARQLDLRDYRAFYDAWKKIPAQSVNKLIEGLDGPFSPYNTMHGGEVFAPPETNTLVPFFIEASRSADRDVRFWALNDLCAMNDPRAIARFTELGSDRAGPESFEGQFVPACLKKYAQFGLLPQKDGSR